jgi:hypothetical protein
MKKILIAVMIFVPLLMATSVYAQQSTTDAQIYREFEICMNKAKKIVDDNKLEGRAIAANCMMQLKKYGDKRAKKAFNTYFYLD